MNRSTLFSSVVTAVVALGALCASTWRAEAQYTQTDLVSNLPSLGATITDPQLVNPWGVSRITSPFSTPFWVSNQGSNNTTLYTVTGKTNVSKVNINAPSGFVSIPTTASGPQGPTGQVSNTNSGAFDVGNGGNGASALFIFANLNGTISAWNMASGLSAFVQPAATTPGAVFSGLAINQGQTMLYAADEAGGKIDVFNSSFAPMSLGSGAFMTPPAIAALGLLPFNVQDLGGNVYVTYAPSGLTAQRNATPGQGGVAVFTEQGVLEPSKTIVGSALAAPWGVALAPAGFGPFGGDLLVGNFSFLNSEINAFDPTTGALLGSIPINPGLGDTAGGLWTLAFGGGGSNGDPGTLYFTDGINGEADGLFGAISVPEPSTWAMMLIGLGGLGLAATCRRRQSPTAIG